MITIPGQLAIKTIHGRNGDFNVARLVTSIGDFFVKETELEQYDQGKYDGDFMITDVRLWTYVTNGKAVTEIRAHVSSMALSSIDSLSQDEAHRLSPQEVDPVDEELQTPQVLPAETMPKEAAQIGHDAVTADSSPVAGEAKSTQGLLSESAKDAELFGTLWPLTQVVKLDATVNRRLFKEQKLRLWKLHYKFEPLTQDWHLKAA